MLSEYYYVVLNDGDTYCGEDGAFVVLLTAGGEEKLSETNSFNQVSENLVAKRVYISDLIDCWIEKNGKF